jgi:sporulation protein YlmC with PRC-barrel domain
MELQNRSGDNLGEVEDVVRGASAGQDMELIVAVGGFAGADEKLIAIPFDEVQISADGDELYTNSTRDQIVAAPAVALERRNVDARQPAVQGAADDARRETERQAADVDADGRAEALEDDDTREAPQGAQTNRATPPPAAAGQANQGARPGSGTVSSASLSERRIGDLLGTEVIGADGESVGEIDDIVLSTAGADDMRAVLQVGGIAGLGEKRIALPLSQLQVQRDADGEPNVRVAMDLDALERQPEYEYEDRTSVL